MRCILHVSCGLCCSFEIHTIHAVRGTPLNSLTLVIVRPAWAAMFCSPYTLCDICEIKRAPRNNGFHRTVYLPAALNWNWRAGGSLLLVGRLLKRTEGVGGDWRGGVCGVD